MSESIHLATRIDRLSRRASAAGPDHGLLEEIGDLLGQGYLCALAADARNERLAERLEQLVASVDQPKEALQIRRISLEKRVGEANVATLRDRLAILRDQFSRLRALPHAG